MPMDPPFPVVQSVPLARPPRRPFRRARRTATELPRQPADTMLVAVLNRGYRVLPSHYRLTDPDLINATAILLVTRRRTLVSSTTLLQAAEPGIAVQVHGLFECQVTDAVRLLRDEGCFNIRPILVRHLLGSPILRMLCASYESHLNWAYFQQLVRAQLNAYNDLNPIVVSGVIAEFLDAQVSLCDHHQNAEWRPVRQRTGGFSGSGSSGVPIGPGEIPRPRDGDPALAGHSEWQEANGDA
ncbi:MAG: hypothetical protein HKP61_16145 [Dactylosporangium sp.]|nr:hypothetical protein [Dactylosporangium sp.]NNJ62437.1 hypothetical protein [Dactylosporangium sp.]